MPLSAPAGVESGSTGDWAVTRRLAANATVQSPTSRGDMPFIVLETAALLPNRGREYDVGHDDEAPMTKPGHEWDATSYHKVSAPQTGWGQSVLSRLELAGDECVLDAGCG